MVMPARARGAHDTHTYSHSGMQLNGQPNQMISDDDDRADIAKAGRAKMQHTTRK